MHKGCHVTHWLGSVHCGGVNANDLIALGLLIFLACAVIFLIGLCVLAIWGEPDHDDDDKV